ncbi:MAG: hypothetical protein J6X02_04485 [Bacilli bacterium]|nr:hypothetical protein [Bacilli bacterium]
MNLVISGPSGAGKGLIINHLLGEGVFKKSVSFTTRKMREGEVNGLNYYFVSKDVFNELKNNGFFFETVEYGGNYYGIPIRNISLVKSSDNTIFDLVPTSGINLKKCFCNTCLLYVIPPTEEILRARRGDRGDNRVSYDIKELELARANYDYLIINGDINETMRQVHNVIDVFQNNSMLNQNDFLDNYFNEREKVRKLVR